MSVESWIILASWRKFDGRAGFGAYYVNLVRSAGLAGPGRAVDLRRNVGAKDRSQLHQNGFSCS